MKTGQGFLLVFSITSLSSLNELTELRDQIIRIKDDDRVPMVLVGNKCDLEEDRAVSRARAFAVSQNWGGTPYYETSARRRANVDEVFKDLCRQMIRKDIEMGRARGRTVEYEDRPRYNYGYDYDNHEDRVRRHRRKHRKGRDGKRHRSSCNFL